MLDAAKALDMIGRPPAMAICPRDRDPLVLTFLWRGYEFACLECGSAYGWLDPTRGQETPDTLAVLGARSAEFAAWRSGHPSDEAARADWREFVARRKEGSS